jgi:hypothetical protein
VRYNYNYDYNDYFFIIYIDEKIMDRNFEACLDHLPEVPEDYNPNEEDVEVVIDKKKKKTVRRL